MDQNKSLRFYRATRRIFPKNYSLRVFTLCFLAVHLPLISFIAVELVRGELQLDILLVLLGATLFGTALAIGGLHGLLKPIALASFHLGQLQKGAPIELDVEEGEDLPSILLAAVANAARSTTRRIGILEDVAATDQLTGLRNRRGFVEEIEKRVEKSGSGSLALIDIDRFKMINDQLGHDRGDTVIKDIAERIRRHAREQDLAARWGGDEFVVFFDGMTTNEATRLLQGIGKALERNSDIRVNGLPVSISCGVVDVMAGQVDQAFIQADQAMYLEKEAKRSTQDPAAA